MQIVTIRPKNNSEAQKACCNAAYQIYVDMFKDPFPNAPVFFNNDIRLITNEEVSSEVLKRIRDLCKEHATDIFLTIEEIQKEEEISILF